MSRKTLKGMTELIEQIESMQPRKVSRVELFKYLYSNKMQAETLWFKLIAATSRLDRENYLAEFEEENIYED